MKKIPTPEKENPYTLADRVAMARAYGLSYGKYMAILNDDTGKLPPMRRPVEWPRGSSHSGNKKSGDARQHRRNPQKGDIR